MGVWEDWEREGGEWRRVWLGGKLAGGGGGVWFFFFFNDTATTEIYTLSLHDALPILEFYLIGIMVLHPSGHYLPLCLYNVPDP